LFAATINTSISSEENRDLLSMASLVSDAQGPTTSTTTAHWPSASSQLSDLPSDPAALSLGNDGLLQYVARSVDEDEEFYFLRFESLQRTNIVALQTRLVRLKDKLRKKENVSDQDLESLRLTLEQYGKPTPFHHNADLTIHENSYRHPELPLHSWPEISEQKHGKQETLIAPALLPVSGQRHYSFQLALLVPRRSR
jgi:hypothetical protein